MDFDFFTDLVDLLDRVSQDRLAPKDLANEAGGIRLKIARAKAMVAALADRDGSLEAQAREIETLRQKIAMKRYVLDGGPADSRRLLGRDGDDGDGGDENRDDRDDRDDTPGSAVKDGVARVLPRWSAELQLDMDMDGAGSGADSDMQDFMQLMRDEYDVHAVPDSQGEDIRDIASAMAQEEMFLPAS